MLHVRKARSRLFPRLVSARCLQGYEGLNSFVVGFMSANATCRAGTRALNIPPSTGMGRELRENIDGSRSKPQNLNGSI